MDGMGPFQIAKQLTEEKIEKPSYYQATRNRGIIKLCVILKLLITGRADRLHGYWKDRNIWEIP